MVKIVWNTWTLKELKNKLQINNLKEYTSLSKSLEIRKNVIIKEWEEETKKKLIDLKNEVILEKKDLEELISKINKGWFLNKIKEKIILYSKSRKIWKLNHKIELIESNFEDYSIKFVENKINSIISQEKLIESLKLLYYWAIWEEKVVNEFKNMYSDWILINDFNQHFNKPIFTKWWKDKIMSIQIDHIFINTKGIFLIETKNRSNNSKESFTFSPIKQIERSGHAFYIYLKDIFKKDKYLNKQVFPNIYKIVVFISWNKIHSTSNFVKVLYLNELKKYINDKFFKINTDEYNYIWELLVKENEI